MPVSGVMNTPGRFPRRTLGNMLGIIGRRPAHGMTREVDTSIKCRRVQSTSGAIQSERMSRLKPLISAVPATRNRSAPTRIVTIFALSSSRLTRGPRCGLVSSSGQTVIEWPFTGCIHVVAQHRRKLATLRTRAHHDPIEREALRVAFEINHRREGAVGGLPIDVISAS